MYMYLGVGLMALALVTGILPQFENCDYLGRSIATAAGTTVPMKCLWSARAEIATAVPLLAVGAILVASRRRETRRTLGIMGVVLGALAVAIPTQLIGTCSSAMPCNLIMKPALIFTGSIIMAGSLAGVVLAQRSKDQES